MLCGNSWALAGVTSVLTEWTWGLEPLVIAILAACAGIVGMAVLHSGGKARRNAIFTEQEGETVFLFDGETLVDATPGARALLSLSPAGGEAWARLVAYAAPRFPGFEQQIAGLTLQGRAVMSTGEAEGDPLTLQAELCGGLLRLTLSDAGGADPPRFDHLAQRAMAEELTQLRDTVAHAPLLIWREQADGAVVWANAAYLLQSAHHLAPGQDLGWPLPRLFERTATGQGAARQRQRLDRPDAGRWFDLVSLPEGAGRLLYALPADAAVQAEDSLRDFMQTLTKTFAHLPIGLAIFDQQRQLALFNPALLDLTGLPPDFLSLRPRLFAFLDAMRDNQMIPEPRDYRSWRKQMLALEKQASAGLYQETWSLASGQTYRVIGRPHPNGALALMFEDISNEMSRTRRYRADLELGQAVIDALDEAIAVFSASGQLVMSNAAYAALWGHDPAARLGSEGIAQICAHWRSLSAAAPLWAEVEQFIGALGRRAAWSGEARLTDGRLIACRFAPLTGGATLAAFRLVAPDGPALNLASRRLTA